VNTLAALLVLPLCACAIGTARVYDPDGTVYEASGIAVGRAEIIACRPDATVIYFEDPNQELRAEAEIGARIGGGTGSSAWWAAFGAAFGALVAVLPALL